MMPVMRQSVSRRTRAHASSSYFSTVMADSPIGYWRLGEASGTTAVDSSGNGNNGTYTPSSGGAWTGGTLGQPGLIADPNTSALFDGSSGYLSPNTVVTCALVTWEAWIQISSRPASAAQIVSFANGPRAGAADKTLYLDTSGKINWYCYDGTAITITSPSAISLNSPHHLVGTADGINMRLYIDGSQVASTACGSTYTGYSVPNTFISGENSGGGAATFFSGLIDEVALYSLALSSTRIAAHYNAGI